METSIVQFRIGFNTVTPFSILTFPPSPVLPVSPCVHWPILERYGQIWVEIASNILTHKKSPFTAMFWLSISNTGRIITSWLIVHVTLMWSSSVAANKLMIISLNYEPLPGYCGKRFLTTYLTITGFGVHGDSGDESSKEQLFRNGRCQKGAEIVRKKFHQIFGIKMPGVRISPLGPKIRVWLMPCPYFSFDGRFERSNPICQWHIGRWVGSQRHRN